MTSSSSQLKKEDSLLQVRDKLRKDSIQLWRSPYYNESTGPSHTDLKVLAEQLGVSLNIKVNHVYDAIVELQQNALEKLKQKKLFKESGLATLKIKILHPNSPSRMITRELLLSMRGIDLKKLIQKEINVGCDKIKLIHSGKVLGDNDNLSSQGVKNGQQIMAVTLRETPKEAEESEKRIKEMEGIKTDSRLLALDDDYMQIEDQFGNAVKIPQDEREALIVAMALHEKGKTALKKDDYSKALIFFLEADEEFKLCNSQLLNSVDNYALLDLDISWCYLCLQSVAHLPEAHERLKRCEERFLKSYGPNLERLIALKGAAGNEAALFMRLHLLQAIVEYHKNNRSEAVSLLKKAQQELAALKVDEGSMVTLVELGYSLAEARLGLRATMGDVNRAANYINESRETRAHSRQKALAQEILEKKKIKLGKCKDGKQYVDPNFVKILVNMGYNKEVARVALQQCNNIISDSIQYIQEHPQPGPSQSKSIELLSLITDLAPELEAAGFDPTMAKLALHKHGGDIMKAAEDLLAGNGIIDHDSSALNDITVESSSTSVGNDADDKSAEKEKAFKRLAEDISMVDDDHLDLTLTQEETFLNQYLSLLESD